MHRIEAVWLLSGTQTQIFFLCSNITVEFRNHLTQ